MGYIRNSMYKIWHPTIKQVVPAISVRFNEGIVEADAQKAIRNPSMDIEEPTDRIDPIERGTQQQAAEWSSALEGGIRNSQRRVGEPASTPERQISRTETSQASQQSDEQPNKRTNQQVATADERADSPAIVQGDREETLSYSTLISIQFVRLQKYPAIVSTQHFLHH